MAKERVSSIKSTEIMQDNIKGLIMVMAVTAIKNPLF